MPKNPFKDWYNVNAMDKDVICSLIRNERKDKGVQFKAALKSSKVVAHC